MGESSALRAVLERIMPADGDGGAIAFGAEGYLDRHFAEFPDVAAAIQTGLAALPADFTTSDTATQDAMLAACESEPWFTRLVELVAEGVYADPGNG
ncbi:MAG: gluconate 2-dehydrogenase subunit 3 family protein, partial [Hyphomicrobiales bacterium]